MSIELNDIECPKEIRDFVRTNKDIIVNEYVDRGCNGEVYFGVRKKMGDEVVLKFYISNENYDSSEEAVILRSIDHENILRIHDLRFIPPYSAFFLSPKISGGDLQTYLDNNVVSSKKALELVAGILKGTTELHTKHELVHRDLKPGNVLLDLPSYRPIIADLGSVKKMSEANNYTTTSKATRLYLPPESIVDEQYYFQSDLYQIGLILFQLLGGYFPLETPVDFLSKREKAKLDKHIGKPSWTTEFDNLIDTKIVKGKIADTNSIPPFLDAPFKRVLNKSLHKDYKMRFQNPSEFLIEIHKLLRAFPSYSHHSDQLLIAHDDGVECKIYNDRKGNIVVEKKKNGGSWRKQNKHDGSFESALQLAKN
ncbi:protein kinase [Reichenbachiella sp.]|uniref:protein kinase domain-containing protein n=1 Tax=Reichenbachiella sp. TaxID=2184521 RepID=UPI003298D11A